MKVGTNLVIGFTLLGAFAWAVPEARARVDERGRYNVVRTSESRERLLEDVPGVWLESVRLEWGVSGTRTQFWALWSPDGLALRFRAEDSSPWFTMRERDEPIWNEEVVEIFLDLDGSGTHYAEYELNPANTLCDLEMLQGVPDVNGNIEWDHEGAEHRVWLLRDEEGNVVAWEARLFLPWDGFRSLPSAHTINLPPKSGDQFRFNAFRIERPGGADAADQDVLFMPYIPTGNRSFHVPAVFHDFVFVE